MAAPAPPFQGPLKLAAALGVCVAAISAAADTERLTFAVLPLRPLAQCTPSVAADFTRRLAQKLRARGAVIVSAAKLARQRPRGREEQVALGRAVGADRVLAGTLRLQAMVRAPGDVWELEVEQIDVRGGREYGSFKRVTAFGSAHGATLLGAFAKRILEYDTA